jgi:hypothetical protein
MARVILIFCPLFYDVDSAVDWFVERGFSDVTLWRGDDGSIRGSGRKPA